MRIVQVPSDSEEGKYHLSSKEVVNLGLADKRCSGFVLPLLYRRLQRELKIRTRSCVFFRLLDRYRCDQGELLKLVRRGNEPSSDEKEGVRLRMLRSILLTMRQTSPNADGLIPLIFEKVQREVSTKDVSRDVIGDMITQIYEAMLKAQESPP